MSPYNPDKGRDLPFEIGLEKDQMGRGYTLRLTSFTPSKFV